MPGFFWGGGGLYDVRLTLASFISWIHKRFASFELFLVLFFVGSSLKLVCHVFGVFPFFLGMERVVFEGFRCTLVFQHAFYVVLRCLAATFWGIFVSVPGVSLWARSQPLF